MVTRLILKLPLVHADIPLFAGAVAGLGDGVTIEVEAAGEVVEVDRLRRIRKTPIAIAATTISTNTNWNIIIFRLEFTGFIITNCSY